MGVNIFTYVKRGSIEVNNLGKNCIITNNNIVFNIISLAAAVSLRALASN